MKSGRSLVSLAQELERQLNSKKDLIVPSTLVRHATDDRGESRLMIEAGAGPVRYSVTPLARRQLAPQRESDATRDRRDRPQSRREGVGEFDAESLVA